MRAIDTHGATVVTVGDEGQVHWSSNAGVNWTQVGGYPAPSGVGGLTFRDIDTGVMIDTYDGPLESRTYIWRTDDGGQSWSSSLMTPIIYDAAYRDASTLSLYAVGENGFDGLVLYSSDGGANWVTIHRDYGLPRDFSFNGIDMCGTGYGIAVGESDSVGTEGEVVTISGTTVTVQPRPVRSSTTRSR